MLLIDSKVSGKRSVFGCISDKPGMVKFLQIAGYSEMLSGIQHKYDPEHLKRIELELSTHGGCKN